MGGSDGMIGSDGMDGKEVYRAGRNSGVNIQWTTVHAHNNERVYRAG